MYGIFSRLLLCKSLLYAIQFYVLAPDLPPSLQPWTASVKIIRCHDEMEGTSRIHSHLLAVNRRIQCYIFGSALLYSSRNLSYPYGAVHMDRGTELQGQENEKVSVWMICRAGEKHSLHARYVDCRLNRILPARYTACIRLVNLARWLCSAEV